MLGMPDVEIEAPKAAKVEGVAHVDGAPRLLPEAALLGLVCEAPPLLVHEES